MLPVLASRRQRRFTPLSLPGLTLWIDASDPSRLFQDSALTTPAAADADPVGGYMDKSLKGRNLAAAGTARPLLKSAVQNGKNVLRFDGVNDLLSFTPTSLTAWTVFIVVDINSKTSFGGVMQWSKPSNAVAGFMLVSDETGTANYTPEQVVISAAGAESAPKKRSAAYALPKTPELSVWTSTPTLTTNGAAQTIADGATGWTNANAAGNIGAGYAFLGMDLAELLVYDSVLSAASIAAVTTYLNAKWALGF